jgi:hypothetical protein
LSTALICFSSATVACALSESFQKSASPIRSSSRAAAAVRPA